MQLVRGPHGNRQDEREQQVRPTPGLLPAPRGEHAQQAVQQKMGGFVQRQRRVCRRNIASPTQEQQQRRPYRSRRVGQESTDDPPPSTIRFKQGKRVRPRAAARSSSRTRGA